MSNSISAQEQAVPEPVRRLVPGTSLNLDLGEGLRRYRGVTRVAGRIVWQCGHYHRNRDLDTLTSGWSAFTCAKRHMQDGGAGKGPDDPMRW